MRIAITLVLACGVALPALADRLPAPNPEQAVLNPGGGGIAANYNFSGFEPPDYVVGNIHGQQGWTTAGPGTYYGGIYAAPAPVLDTQSYGALYDPAGPGFGGAWSPELDYGTGGGTVSWSVYFTNPDPYGNNQDFIPQSPTAGYVVTRVERNWSTQTIRVLDQAVGDWVDLGWDMTQDVWHDWFLDVAPGGAFDLYYDGSLVYSGMGYTDQIEQIVMGYIDNYAGNDFYYDNLEVYTIPEPATLGLFALGALGLLRRR